MLTNLKIIFSVELSNKFAARLLFYFPPRVVATLPCELQNIKMAKI